MNTPHCLQGLSALCTCCYKCIGLVTVTGVPNQAEVPTFWVTDVLASLVPNIFWSSVVSASDVLALPASLVPNIPGSGKKNVATGTWKQGYGKKS
jgi:hypothetical protein